MDDLVHARLDAHTREILRRLKRRHGWTDSETVRNGIRALAELELPPEDRSKRIAGLGKFSSGMTDLGSNPDHLRDFGR